jgi:SAM-dependent methyltransferase
MDATEVKAYAAELKNMLTHATMALTTIQGIDLGFFDSIPPNKPVTAQELSGQLGYDIIKVERWLRFAVAGGYLTRSGPGYVLTGKGAMLRRGTPLPDLLGLHHMVGYFTRAISNSKDAYQKGVGLDSITKGKISRDYIPRVAAQLSRTAASFFQTSGVSTGHTILDLGCGDGSVLRETVIACPGVSATGVDINVHTVEMGRQRNADQGLQDQIDLQVGDVTDLKRFKDGAFDWVYAINVFHFLPVFKRETFLRDMIRISRYGIFTNQVITNNIATLSTDVLLSTLFTDFTGFFSVEEADTLVEAMGIRHYRFLPIIQGESRLLAMFTSSNDVPLKRIPDIAEKDIQALEAAGIATAKDLLSASEERLQPLALHAEPYRKAAIKILFP